MAEPRRATCCALGLTLLLIAGCAPKPIAKEYRQQAQAENITFPMVLQDPDAYTGSVVLWGGIIIETHNVQDGTNITVLQTPLQGSERPAGRSASQGRFIAQSGEFLDPEVYKNGRKITLAGVVTGKEVRPLGGSSYTYPVVAVKQLYLWQPPPPPAYGYYPYWGPLWDPFWGPYWSPYYRGSFGFYGGFEGDIDGRFRGRQEREEHERGGARPR